MWGRPAVTVGDFLSLPTDQRDDVILLFGVVIDDLFAGMRKVADLLVLPVGGSIWKRR
ncbi:MAG: hypothetical protein U0871_05045 [Gemmataceae bacterium]